MEDPADVGLVGLQAGGDGARARARPAPNRGRRRGCCAAAAILGSPTVRVDGRDVDPQAEERRDYGLSCRVYRTERGLAGLPDARWLRAALRCANEV